MRLRPAHSGRHPDANESSSSSRRPRTVRQTQTQASQSQAARRTSRTASLRAPSRHDQQARRSVNLKCDSNVSGRIVETVIDSSFSSSRSHTVRPSLQSVLLPRTSTTRVRRAERGKNRRYLDTRKASNGSTCEERRLMERATGIEPVSEAWEASVLPLY
jgi:hypothetical protein